MTSCCERAKIEIDRLSAERDVWVEYVTCDRADLVLALEAARKENAALRAELAAIQMSASMNMNISPNPDAVLSFADWLRLAGISKQTGLRLRAAGQAPRFWQLSPSRIGTTVAEHRAWLASRDQAEVQYDIKPADNSRRRSFVSRREGRDRPRQGSPGRR